MKKLLVAFFLLLFLAGLAFAKVDINTATVDELVELNGIAQVKAKAIVAYRTEHGPFASIEDITNVKGIGDKLFEKIKDEIMVTEPHQGLENQEDTVAPTTSAAER